ncbi:hypothetical protein GGR57DRAFT_479597 [Xylariaceae sp. FL1272]|nr:hypothetical protein GGR57DRAFT_479597 [Xylariaceae sp. FL1272]
MAGSLAALKNLECPAGDACTAFQCLFKHARDGQSADNKGGGSHTDSHTTESVSQSQSHPSRPQPAAPHIESPAHSEQESPRKRVKIDSTSTVGSQLSSTSSNPPKLGSSEQRRVAFDPTSATITKNGAPASTNRMTTALAQVKFQSSDQQISAQTPLDIPSSAPGKNTVTAKVINPKQASKQPETLNPRLLKKAPCSHSTRVALVKALHKEYERLNNEVKKSTKDGDAKKLLLSDQELIVRTLDDEQDIALKNTAIYNTKIRNLIMRYKKMPVSEWEAERTKAVLENDPNSTKSTTAAPLVTTIETGLTTQQEIKFLPRLVWDLTALSIYGYVSTIPSDEDITAAKDGVAASGNTESCDRCTRRFQTFPGRREEDGALASNGSCTFHPGKRYYMENAPGDRSKPKQKYRCCHRDIDDDSGGCTTAPTHVFKTTDPKRLAATLNFTNTPVNPTVPKDRAVTFDCEMGYTVYGLELIRMTLVSWPHGMELLDILVQPVGEILDPNTRYSGVTAEAMATAERYQVGGDHRPTMIPSSDPSKPPQRKLKIAPSPEIARNLLFSMVSADTPLIGHGLENDLNATRIIHPTCIDTVLLWPHKRGLPIRNGLKYLMETKLGRKIQLDPIEGSPEGHDSVEDARAAGDLVRLKIRDEWKSLQMKGWTLGPDGDMVSPGQEWTVVGGAKVKKPGF